ncbi:hypothetical protein MRX96_003322 [Rhipicephalus microplus]
MSTRQRQVNTTGHDRRPVYHQGLLPYKQFTPSVKDYGVVAGPKYVGIMELLAPWSLYGNQRRGKGPQSGTGELHERARDNAPQDVVGAEEGHGDALQNPADEKVFGKP